MFFVMSALENSLMPYGTWKSTRVRSCAAVVRACVYASIRMPSGNVAPSASSVSPVAIVSRGSSPGANMKPFPANCSPNAFSRGAGEWHRLHDTR